MAVCILVSWNPASRKLWRTETHYFRFLRLDAMTTYNETQGLNVKVFSVYKYKWFSKSLLWLSFQFLEQNYDASYLYNRHICKIHILGNFSPYMAVTSEPRMQFQRGFGFSMY